MDTLTQQIRDLCRSALGNNMPAELKTDDALACVAKVVDMYRAANDLARGYLEQNQRFSRLVERRSCDVGQLQALLTSLLRAGERLHFRVRPTDDSGRAEELAEWSIFAGMVAAVEAEMKKIEAGMVAANPDDAEIVDWIASHWDSQCPGPQTLILPTMDNANGSFRDAVKAQMQKTRENE